MYWCLFKLTLIQVI